jgi:DNA (cytosine-5)-methyltransferase 1
MTHGSLFSGIGGFDLAADQMGWENKFHCEINPFGQKILKHYWPNATSYEDIKKTDFTIHRGNIDVLSGGFPCQPYSTAGKRKGTDDDRHLWPEMLRAIGEIAPRWIVGENVRGLVNWSDGLVFEQVCVDLENKAYEVQPFLLPSCGVNAPHRRDRIFFVAFNPNNPRRCDGHGQVRGTNGKISERNDRSQPCNPDSRIVADPNQNGGGRCGHEKIGCEAGKGQTKAQKRQRVRPELKRIDEKRVVADPERGQRKGGRNIPRMGRVNEQIAQCGWDEFPTESAICGGNDGISTELDGITFPKWRRESIAGFGNAIVPPLVLQLFKTIEEYELNL